MPPPSPEGIGSAPDVSEAELGDAHDNTPKQTTLGGGTNQFTCNRAVGSHARSQGVDLRVAVFEARRPRDSASAGELNWRRFSFLIRFTDGESGGW